MTDLSIIFSMIFVFLGICIFSLIMYSTWIVPLRNQLENAETTIGRYEFAYKQLSKKMNIATDYLTAHADSGELDAKATLDAINKVKI